MIVQPLKDGILNRTSVVDFDYKAVQGISWIDV